MGNRKRNDFPVLDREERLTVLIGGLLSLFISLAFSLAFLGAAVWVVAKVLQAVGVL